MKSRIPAVLAVAAAAGLLAAGSPARAADLGSEIKKAMKEKAGKTWYLKTSLPYLYGRHPYGVFKRPLVTVTPADGTDIQESPEMQGSIVHAEGRRLELRVNDPIAVKDFEWQKGEQLLDLEVAGTGAAKESEGVLRFQKMTTMADFETCWSETFSDVSIETKYDWPDDIKKAVRNREVREGMVPEMVVVALGNPERMTTETKDSKKVEVWVFQMGEGTRMGYWTQKMGDKKEVEVRFAEGKVIQVGTAASEAPKVKLK